MFKNKIIRITLPFSFFLSFFPSFINISFFPHPPFPPFFFFPYFFLSFLKT